MSTDNIDHAAGGKEDSILPLGPITIDAVYLSVSSPLLDWFFQQEGPDDYSLFRRGEKPGDKPKLLHRNIVNGGTFEIESFRVTVHFFTDPNTQEKKAHGTWNKKDGQEDGGTFTAQAGGGVATTASASA